MISDRASCLSLEAAEKYGSRKAMIVSRNELGGRAMGRSRVQLRFCSSAGCRRCQEHNMNIAWSESQVTGPQVTGLQVTGPQVTGPQVNVAGVSLLPLRRALAAAEDIDCVEAVWLCPGSHLLAPQAGKNLGAVNSRVRPCR